MKKIILLVIVFSFLGCRRLTSAFHSPSQNNVKSNTTYYLDSQSGNDSNNGLTPEAAWKSLAKASSIKYVNGDSLLLKKGSVFNGELNLNATGKAGSPVVVSAYPVNDSTAPLPVINAKGYLAGIHVINGDYLNISDLEITADAGTVVEPSANDKRYGVLVEVQGTHVSKQITLKNLYIHNIFASHQVAAKGQNPTSNMGKGIAFLADDNASFNGILVENCRIEMTGNTGIQLSGSSTNPKFFIQNVQILNNNLKNIGGPGIQPGKCSNVLVKGNVVDSTGSLIDPRMHGRGSGIWPWTCNNVLIENNAFMHAHGKADSHGAHIDFNCNNVVIQYNLSEDNQGGFVEILGNDHNCSYRYNISINDGSRVKGVDGATQQGETLFISGYTGSKPRKGPYDNYIYNNTIFVKKSIVSNFFLAPTTDGLLVANNIFYILGKTQTMPLHNGSYVSSSSLKTVIFKNNLYLSQNTLPPDFPVRDISPLYGNPGFALPGGLKAKDYIPSNAALIKGKGIHIEKLPGDSIGLKIGLTVKKDFFGNPITGSPDIGAIEMK